jgi:hypothetical protein
LSNKHTFIQACFYFCSASLERRRLSSFVLGWLAGVLLCVVRLYGVRKQRSPRSVPRAAPRAEREKEQIIFIRGFYFVCVEAENESYVARILPWK